MRKSITSEFCWLTLSIVVAVICVIIALYFRIHIYSALTLGFIVLFAITLLLEKNKHNIVPLLCIWFLVVVWVFAYAIYKCACNQRNNCFA